MPNKFAKITLYCSSLSWGGLEMNVVRFARKFQERGHSTTVYCIEGSEIAKHCKNRSVDTHFVKRNKRYYDFWKAQAVAKTLNRYSEHVLWVNDPRDLDFCTWIKRLSKADIKVVYNQGMQFSKPKKSMFHSFRFKAIDAWVAPLPYLKKQVEEMTNFRQENIYYIPRGVAKARVETQLDSDQAKEVLDLPKGSLMFGVIGRLDKLKGQDTAIKALANMENKEAHLVIMGEETRNEGSNYQEELTQLTKTLEIADRVHFKPFCDAVSLFFASIDFCIVPSHAETIGMTTIEAMLAGTPIIGTNTSGTPELLDQGQLGYLFPPEDADTLAKWMNLAVTSPKLLHEKSALAKSHAQAHFELDKVIDAYERMLQAL